MHYLHRGLMDGHSDIYIPFVYKHMKEICVGSQVHQIYTYLSNGSVWKLMVIAFFFLNIMRTVFHSFMLIRGIVS